MQKLSAAAAAAADEVKAELNLAKVTMIKSCWHIKQV